MVGTLPFKSRDKPDEELPSITEEIQRQQEAEQSDIKKQLEHAQQQIDLKHIQVARAIPGQPNCWQRSIRR